MAEPIGALRVEMSAGWAQLRADMGKAVDSVKTASARMQRAIYDAERSWGKLEKAAMRYAKYAAGAALAGAAYGFVRLTKDAIAAADAIYDTAQIVGISVESLSRLQFAAKISGVEVEALTKGLTFLNRTTANAVAGELEYVKALASVGMSIRDVTDATGKLLPLDQVLAKVADRFASLPDGPAKAAAAVRLFSRSGAAMIPMLNLGSAGMKALADQSDKLGQTIGNDLAANANQLGDQMDALRGALRGVGLALGDLVLPKLLAVTQAMLDAKMAGQGLFKTLMEGAKVAVLGTELDQRRKVLQTLKDDLELMRAPISPGNVIGKTIARATWGTEGFLEAEIAKQTAAVAELEQKAKDATDALAGLGKKPEAGTSWEKILADLDATDSKAGKADDSLAKLAERERERTAEAIADLEREKALTGDVSRLAKTRWAIEHEGLAKADPLAQERLKQLASELDMLDLIAGLETASAAQVEASAQRAAQIIAENMTETEQLRENLAELDRLHKGLPKSLLVGDLDVPDAPLDDAQYERARRRLLEVAKAEQEVADGADDVTVHVDIMVQAFDSFASNATDALVDFAMTGEASFAQFTRAVLRDLVRIQIQAAVTQLRIASITGGSTVAQLGAHLTQGVTAVGAGTTGTISTGGSFAPPLMKLAAAPQLDVGASYAGLSRESEPAGKPVAGQSIRIVNVLDPAVVNDWAASPSGEKVILNAIARHATQLRALVR